jgi:uncharacterized membrane protein
MFVSSDIEIISEFSGSVIGAEKEMVWVGVGSHQINVVLYMNQNDFVSVFVVGMGSDIEIVSQVSVVVVGNEKVVV